MELSLKHYGIGHDDNPPGRGSGRYAYGSGENPNQHIENMTLGQQRIYYLNKYRKEGVPDGESLEGYVAGILGYKNSKALRNAISLQDAAASQETMDKIRKLYFDPENPITSPTKIQNLTGIPEPTVRGYIKKFGKQTKNEVNEQIANQLKAVINDKTVVDVGLGVEYSLGITETRKDKIISMLEQEGYQKVPYYQRQLSTGKNTTVTLLCKEGMTYEDVKEFVREHGWGTIDQYVTDGNGNRSILGIPPVQSVDLDRVLIKYKEDGGDLKDGVIELRRGPEDLSLGAARYAQVRIGVDDKYYLKGVAVYGDDKDFPEGKDIIFNSSKSKDLPLEKVLKPMKKDVVTGEIDQDNPFGASIKREEDLVLAKRTYIDPKTGEEKVSPINIVSEEGDWVKWSKNTPSQFLSKQSPQLIKQQLDLAYAKKVAEYDDIKTVSNESVRRVMLQNFFEQCDTAAVELKGAAFHRQQTHLLLPLTTLKDGQIYAPNYETGEEVFLIRYPHQGKFEIPKLTVNNNNKEGQRVIGNAPDAVGVSNLTAHQLSGADFDGDTVTVIPYNVVPGSSKHNAIAVEKARKELMEFEPKEAYKAYPGMPPVKGSGFDTQLEMGKISNLVTDMTLKEAPTTEIIQAVKHAQVIIDAEKHNLDWQRSERENGIIELKKKWQGKPTGGASTLISRASAPEYVKERRLSFAVDDETGKKITFETHATKRERKPTGEIDEYGRKVYADTGRRIDKTQKSKKMAETDDANSLLSVPYDRERSNPKEVLYADYANSLKALANRARLEWNKTPTGKKDKASEAAYSKEVSELETMLVRIKQNSPRERYAQQRATNNYYKKLKEKDYLEEDERKKIKNQCLSEARSAVQADKGFKSLTPKQWEAIENHAISGTKAEQIIKKVDSKLLMQYALPKANRELSASKVSLIKSLARQGIPQSEIAEQLNIAVGTVNKYMSPAQ